MVNQQRQNDSGVTGRGVIIRGCLRIECMTEQLVRIELAGASGSFCDDLTFMVKERAFPGITPVVRQTGNLLTVVTPHYRIQIDLGAKTPQDLLDSIHICDAQDETPLWRALEDWPCAWSFPRPEQPGKAWAVADAPRAIVPPWGAAPAPPEALRELPPSLAAANGWRFEPEARDVYVFLHRGDLRQLRREFLQLTGPIPLIPLWALGLWNSRYYPYSEQSALATVERYRAEGIGLDGFVIDTDWRQGASRGYDINTELFPDMERFLQAMRQKHAHVLFNDHPEPLNGWATTDPRLLEYREEHLTRLVRMGLTSWWFDRNWTEIIPGPMEGIESAVWGQALYYDILQHQQPEQRTMILSMWSEHAASHRYPVWWTGDIHSDWETLREGVCDTVAAGDRLLPWVHQDLGGHIGFPSPEQYTRWIQWGAFAPIMRLHCGPHDRCRYPWAYGPDVLPIVREYVALRYRLLPLFYAAAHRAAREGTPILRKLAHEWPAYAEAAAEDQFLLGDDLLVAPVVTSENEADWIAEPLVLRGGFKLEAFAERTMQGEPLATQTVDEVRLNPQYHSMRIMAWGPRHSLRWSGVFTPAVEGDYKFHLAGNGRKGLWIGESNVIIDGFDKGHNAATLHLNAGEAYPLRVHYHLDGLGIADCRLSVVRLLDCAELKPARRTVWVPPGDWEDLWSGAMHTGPATITMTAGLHQIPLFVRRGAVVPLAPPMLHTGERPWDPLTLEVFTPAADAVVKRELYEDDGASMGYLRGAQRVTPFVLQREGAWLSLLIGPGAGEYPGFLASRTWIARLHLLPGEMPEHISVNGQTVKWHADAGELTEGVGRLLAPKASECESNRMPLCGAGSRPRQQAGNILELMATGDRVAIEIVLIAAAS
jgi:hypothetical protein